MLLMIGKFAYSIFVRIFIFLYVSWGSLNFCFYFLGIVPLIDKIISRCLFIILVFRIFYFSLLQNKIILPLLQILKFYYSFHHDNCSIILTIFQNE